LNHRETELACIAERAFLRSLGGGCQFPIAAHAKIDGDQLTLAGLVAAPQGERILRETLAGSRNQPERIGSQLAEWLMKRGAMDLLNV
jgi:hydroxymethylbilane synthase